MLVIDAAREEAAEAPAPASAPMTTDDMLAGFRARMRGES
jgi:hypothetical protein